MSFIAGVLYNRRRQRIERRRAALSSVVAPPVEHPLLGLGGRSIELSLAQGESVSPEAVTLAAQTLHDVIDRFRATPSRSTSEQLAEIRESAAFLLDAADDVEVAADVRGRLENDVRTFRGSR